MVHLLGQDCEITKSCLYMTSVSQHYQDRLQDRLVPTWTHLSHELGKKLSPNLAILFGPAFNRLYHYDSCRVTHRCSAKALQLSTAPYYQRLV
jgi:hypothetical protein